MVGRLMCDAALAAELTANLDVTFVERYIDGIEIGRGLVQGIGFGIKGGRPSYRVGVAPEERGDVTIEVTAAAAKWLNGLRIGDPSYAEALRELTHRGDMLVEGDISRLGSWLDGVHDPIVERTA